MRLVREQKNNVVSRESSVDNKELISRFTTDDSQLLNRYPKLINKTKIYLKVVLSMMSEQRKLHR